ncbi:M15 family metallopeptidase [Nocardia sp. NPDC057455]|uniref:M15 family metallopeptidase n=1 Tax=Nocardia sp. NPDC057455 TaxID=3346138 RepID=UPI00366DC682
MVGLSMALPALIATGAPAGQARADAAVVIEQRESVGSAAGTEGLDPPLALSYTLAEREAHAQGVPLSITSGYRTPAEQQALWEDGVATYGADDARRWVLPPEESTHVSGQAIDVGPQQGARWLEVNGYRWGLCRMFENEYWHFELQTVPGVPCPPMLPDASVR